MDQTKVSVKRTVLQQIRQDLGSNRSPQANKSHIPFFLQANVRSFDQRGPWWLPYTSFVIHYSQISTTGSYIL